MRRETFGICSRRISAAALTVLILIFSLGLSGCGKKAPAPVADNNGGGITVNNEEAVSVYYADEKVTEATEYEEFRASSDDYSVALLIVANESVKDFKVLSLECEDIDEKGNVSFNSSELYSIDELTPEKSLLLWVTFYGTIPNNGFSYVDAEGNTRSFSVDMSGMDGSLLVNEII